MIPFDITLADILMRLLYVSMGASWMWLGIKLGAIRSPS